MIELRSRNGRFIEIRSLDDILVIDQDKVLGVWVKYRDGDGESAAFVTQTLPQIAAMIAEASRGDSNETP